VVSAAGGWFFLNEETASHVIKILGVGAGFTRTCFD